MCVHWHENDGDTDDINGDGTNAVVLEVKEICPCCQHSSASLFHATKNSTRLRCQTIYVSWFSFMVCRCSCCWWLFDICAIFWYSGSQCRGVTVIRCDSRLTVCLKKWCRWPILLYKNRNLIKISLVYLCIPPTFAMFAIWYTPHLLFNLIMNFPACVYFVPFLSDFLVISFRYFQHCWCINNTQWDVSTRNVYFSRSHFPPVWSGNAI